MSSEATRHLCTRDEAAAIVKRVLRAKGRAYMSVMMSAPVADDPEHVFPFGLHTTFHLSWKEALRVCGDIISETLEAKGARIPVRVYEAETGKSYSRPSVWIG